MTPNAISKASRWVFGSRGGLDAGGVIEEGPGVIAAFCVTTPAASSRPARRALCRPYSPFHTNPIWVGGIRPAAESAAKSAPWIQRRS